jgi:hypothetical protein
MSSERARIGMRRLSRAALAQCRAVEAVTATLNERTRLSIVTSRALILAAERALASVRTTVGAPAGAGGHVGFVECARLARVLSFRRGDEPSGEMRVVSARYGRRS